MLYVYGVVRADHPPPRERARLLPSGPIAAAVADVPDDFVIGEDEAREHLDVLAGLLRDGPVIPVRLGTVVPGEDAVKADILEPDQARFTELLDRLDSYVELHVDVDDDEVEAIESVAASVPRGSGWASDMQSQLELGRQVASLIEERRLRLADEILNMLRPLADRDAPRSVGGEAENRILRWAFLVGRDDVDAFDGTVREVRMRYPSLTINYIGPLPAAHFLDLLAEPRDTSGDAFRGSGNWGW